MLYLPGPQRHRTTQGHDGRMRIMRLWWLVKSLESESDLDETFLTCWNWKEKRRVWQCGYRTLKNIWYNFIVDVIDVISGSQGLLAPVMSNATNLPHVAMAPCSRSPSNILVASRHAPDFPCQWPPEFPIPMPLHVSLYIPMYPYVSLCHVSNSLTSAVIASSQRGKVWTKIL